MTIVTPNPPTNIADFRGFDSSIILIERGGIPRFIGKLPESLSQAMLVGTMLVGRLGVHNHSEPPLSVCASRSACKQACMCVCVCVCVHACVTDQPMLGESCCLSESLSVSLSLSLSLSLYIYIYIYIHIHIYIYIYIYSLHVQCSVCRNFFQAQALPKRF